MIILDNVTISDALYALDYPVRQNLPAKFPSLTMRNCLLKNNFYGVRSNRQYIHVPYFHDNVFDGAPHPQVCSCDAVNAFDFTDVNAFLTIRIADPLGGNVIRNYEKGFDLVNSNLHVEGFTVESLRDYANTFYVPNNVNGSAATGIDFFWTKQVNSHLTLDNMTFQDFIDQNATGIGVRVQSWGGQHNLTAVASVAPTTNDPGSIETNNVAGAYYLLLGPNSKLNGHIKYNTLQTGSGTKYGFGILGNFLGSQNYLRIDSNELDVNAGVNSNLNAGISLITQTEGHQDFKILDNHIRVALPLGEGIGITKTNDFIIRRNTIEGGSVEIPGIQLDLGAAGIVDCNLVRDKRTGVVINNSRINRYAANFLRSNKRDMEFFGNMLYSHFGSDIKWNRFFQSEFQSLLYYPGARTGKQWHNQYNRWEVQFGVEAEHLGGTLQEVLACQFWHPYGEPEGTIMHPDATPNNLFEEVMGNPPIDTLPDPQFCSTANDDVNMFQDTIPDAELEWKALIEDTAFWASLTPAVQTMQRQDIYGILLDNPGWVDGNSTFTAFLNSMATDFVGESETLKRNMQALQGDIENQHLNLQAQRAALDSMGMLAGTWIEMIAGSPDSTEQDSLQALLDPLMKEADSLMTVITESDSLFWVGTLDSITQLQLQNANLDDSQWHYWSEKRLNEIILNDMAGVTADSLALADVRSIAQTCLVDGGRAVLGARGLARVWLQEYYDDYNCQQPQGRSALSVPSKVAVPELQVIPNPASEMVTIRWEETLGSGTIELQVVSMNGRVVYSEKIQSDQQELTIPVKTWADGLYLVRLTGATVRTQGTFVVQH